MGESGDKVHANEDDFHPVCGRGPGHGGRGPGGRAGAAQAEAGADHIDRLVKQLGDKDYFVRQQAEDALAALGFEAFDALNQAVDNPDVEIAARARSLLRQIQIQWIQKDDPPRVKQLLNNYESLDPESRQSLMHSLVALPDGAGVPALCRLVRLEKSELLSKQAALVLLGSVKAGADPRPSLVQTVRKVLGSSRRPAAQWLLTYARSGEDTAAAGAPWTKLVEAEQSLLAGSSTQTTAQIVTALWRFQVARLQKLGRNEEAIAAIRHLVRLESGDPETLSTLVEWLVEQKAWQALDDVAERFAPQIAANQMLLYLVADARLTQGKKERAEELARQALGLNPGKDPDALENHFLAAIILQRRGLFSWSLREYRHVIAACPPKDDTALRARITAADMLHDQADDLAAAEMLHDAIKAAGIDLPAKTPLLPTASGENRTLGQIRAQMNVYYACHWEKKADQAKRLACLDQALQDDANNVNVLIACYQLPQQKPDFHQRLMRLIRARGSRLAAENPARAGRCEQLQRTRLADRQHRRRPGRSPAAVAKIAGTEPQQRRPLRYPGPRLFLQGRLRKRD